MTPMGRLIALLVLLVSAIAAVAAVDNARIGADTPVAVLPAPDLVLLLPVSPTPERIVADLSEELRSRAAGAADEHLRSALERMAADPALLRQVATRPADMFVAGEAVATATALYDVELDPAQVTVVVMTVELIPGYGSTAISRDHEDGHALINREIAYRCARPGLEALVASGHQGERLINGLIAFLDQASGRVHDGYHRLVGGGAYGQHVTRAREALTDAPGCG